MLIDLYGLTFDTPSVTFFLWSPWRSSSLEHKLFEAMERVPGVTVQRTPEEWRATLDKPQTWKAAITKVEGIMKGWQEDASDAGSERRAWRWMLESDTDSAGYSENGESASMWGFLRILLDSGRPGEEDKGELVDLNGFGLCIHGNQRG
ncbi:hypothetical protein [Tuwongella immobilis]|uniref:Uncharacterized protein n=1 Tax=Tuwongella immobilis TaxID=692036 RepID=A0A6C2YUK5_9BACT|nr:hypothetical protein [Tuwongella immobilis]VIP05176.1 unnamed protein product [Tuwongella immobilis]VTS07708.1 unnamed protein product [Tuwongella immobilis]